MVSAHDLKYFVAIAETKKLRKAAEALHISQPALTHALKRLEDHLDVQLFERNRKGLILTRQGEKLLSVSKGLLSSWENLPKLFSETPSGFEGRLRIGSHPSVALYSLPKYLPRLLKLHPHADIELFHDLSRHVTQAVVDGDIDLGLVINPTAHPDLILRKLGDDEVTLWKRAENFDDKTLIYDPALAQVQWILKKLGKKNEFKRRIESGNLEVVAQLVQEGCGVGILPRRVLPSDKIRRWCPTAPVFKDEIYLVYRASSKHLDNIVKWVSLEAVSK